MDSSQRPAGDPPKAGSDVDAGFERLLKDAMTRRLRAAAGSECLDAETLAAWSDGALPPSERSFVEAHASRCARCQDMLAVLARTAPVAPERSPWSMRHWIMMLAPAATATAAVALWFAIAPPPPASEPRVAQVAVAEHKDAAAGANKGAPAEPSAQAPPAASAREGSASAAAPPSSQMRDSRAALDRATTEKEGDSRRRLATSKDVDRFEPSSKLAKAEAAPARQDQATALDDEKRKPATPPVATPAPAPPPPAAAVGVTSDSTASAAPLQQAAQSQNARAAVQQADQQPRAFGGSAAGRSGGVLNRAELNEAVQVIPVVGARSDGNVQWRALAAHIVQHSADKGTTWATQYTLDDKAAIVAGSAPSTTVAWFVGRAGLVLLTVDGRTWRRVPFPEAVDLVSVIATDDRTAIVTAADRRVFTTTDGGISWVAGKD